MVDISRTSFHGDDFMVSKPTHHWGAPSSHGVLILAGAKTEPRDEHLLVGGLEHGLNMAFILHILGMSSSQLTNSMIFQRGRAQPPTS